jgi:hypothetical protein
MKVSVVIITYNQERMLSVAIESVLRQTANFEFELIVAEDHSTDGTADVLRGLERRHPDRIRSIYREKNVGATANLIDALSHCRGQYVAILEGDDCWTDPRKLQRQADFLDTHPECTLCGHAVNYVYDDGRLHQRQPEEGKTKTLLNLEDILSGTAFHTCSYMFRYAKYAPPDWLRTLWITDWSILVLLAEQGPVGYIDEVMAEYRVHSGGIWSGSSAARQAEGRVDMVRCVRRHLGSRCSAETAALLALFLGQLARQRELAGRRDEARHLYVEAVRTLLEETPADEQLADGLTKAVVRISDQAQTESGLDASRLRRQLHQLRRQLSDRDGQLAAASAELARLKASRIWRARQFLASLPGARRLAALLRIS